MEYYSAIKRNELSSNRKTWRRDLKCMLLGERIGSAAEDSEVPCRVPGRDWHVVTPHLGGGGRQGGVAAAVSLQPVVATQEGSQVFSDYFLQKKLGPIFSCEIS